MKPRIAICIPCYGDVPPVILEDYMRWMYHLGRRVTEYDFMLSIKSKSEQFRARNAMVTASLQLGCTHTWMVDDDQIFDWTGYSGPCEGYDIIRKLMEHDKPIVGALYYQRGALGKPVVMKEAESGIYQFLHDAEIKDGLQEVAVTGGGCMLIDNKVFDKIESPWFEPESSSGLGTDIQICEKARSHGFSVWCDTSLVVGHLRRELEVITPLNRSSNLADRMQDVGLNEAWHQKSWVYLYREDAIEFSGLSPKEFMDKAQHYFENHGRHLDPENPKEYYKSLGVDHIARNVMFHLQEIMIEQSSIFMKFFNKQVEAYGLDFGCGTAPVGFALAMKGHKLDFVDIEGSKSWDFVKWRAERRGITAGFELAGPYDYVLLLDIIEHLRPEEFEEVISDIIGRMKPGAGLVTNYFENKDYANHEHINMNKDFVKEILLRFGVYPVNTNLWIKQDIGGKQEEAA